MNKIEAKSIEQYEVVKLLSKGTFGDVFVCHEKLNPKLMALKVMHLNPPNSEKSKSKKKKLSEDKVAFQHFVEADVLQKITNSPFLLHLENSFCTCNSVCLVTEYVSGGDLYQHLYECKGSKFFPENHVKFYGAEIVCGLKYLHHLGIIYRDLKLENIILDQEGHIKIVDFGLCKQTVSSDRKAVTFCGSPEYMAPEVIEGTPYDFKVDCWSLGVILFELSHGSLPFYNQNLEILFEKVLMDKVKFHRPLTNCAQHLISGLLDKNPNSRLSLDDASTHEFFSELDWKKIELKEIEPPFIPSSSALTCKHQDKFSAF